MSQTPELRHPVRGLVRGTFWPLSRAAPLCRRGRVLVYVLQQVGGCSTGKRRSYPLHARRAAAARRAGGAHGWPRVFKLARNGDETAVCRRPKAVNACLLRPHPSSYTHGSIHRKQRLHSWPQCRARSISWYVAIASLTLSPASPAPLHGRCSDAVAGFEQTQRCLPVYMVHIHKP